MHRFVLGGDDPIRGDLGEGREDELAFVHARVGEDEVVMGEDVVGVEEEVEVEGSGPPPLLGVAIAPALELDAVEFGEELAGREIGLDDGGGVEEVGLGDGADGRGLVEGGGGDEACARERGEAQEGGAEVSVALADVGTECDGGAGGHGGG